MSDITFLHYLGGALTAALLGGLAARALGLPLLVGYLIAGVVVGPHTPGVFANEEAIGVVAKLGAALLMFTVGVHLSLHELAAVRRVALLAGGIQILGTVLLGLGAGLALGWGVYGGVFLGCALALSSTAVMTRLLEERAELRTRHGSIILGILIVQDLAVVAMVPLLTSLGGASTRGMEALRDVALSLLLAIGLLAAAVLLAQRGVPALLRVVTRSGSQELFLLTVVCVCLAAAYLAEQAGLSLELGAFLAGLVISESDYSDEVFSQIRPLRDAFASLFFVSIGMLANPALMLGHWQAVLLVVAVILLGKAALTSGAVFGLGYHARTAVLTGLGLAQIGEFSFVLTALGTARKLISPELAGVVIAAALLTILLTPLCYGMGEPFYRRLNAIPSLSALLNRLHRAPAEATVPSGSSGRVIVLGCGRVGLYVSEALSARGVPHVVVDYDDSALEAPRRNGAAVVYGDAASEVVLSQALPEGAELAIVALPEASPTLMAVRVLKRLAPGLPIVARAHEWSALCDIREAGAEAVVHAELEAAAAMITLGLDRLGLLDEQTRSHIASLRERSCERPRP